MDLGHCYYAEAAALLHDMFDLLRRDAAPDDRQPQLARGLRESDRIDVLAEHLGLELVTGRTK